MERKIKSHSLQDALSVGAYIDYLNTKLPQYGARVWGEVSSISSGPTGHIYYTVKDQEKEAVLQCVIWRSKYAVSGIELETGTKVIISGSPNLYAPRGQLTFITDTIELVGEGALQKAYEELKKKLAVEGVFDPIRKRPLPKYPSKIGVITSLRSGTVIHDLINNLGRFGFQVVAVNSRVEGKEAIHDILQAIRTLARKDIEVLVIMRGGGSFEALQAFDNEVIVRELVGFSVPVIAAIGHHKDVPLVALAADIAVSTPTAVAQILNYNWEQARAEMQAVEMKIFNIFSNTILNKKLQLERTGNLIQRGFGAILTEFKSNEQKMKFGIRRLQRQLQGFPLEIKKQGAKLIDLFSQTLSQQQHAIIDSWHRGIVPSFEGKIQQSHASLEGFWSVSMSQFQTSLRTKKLLLSKYGQAVELNDPERQLNLGYALVHLNGRLVRSVKQLNKDSEIVTRFSDGLANSKVKSIRKK